MIRATINYGNGEKVSEEVPWTYPYTALAMLGLKHYVSPVSYHTIDPVNSRVVVSSTRRVHVGQLDLSGIPEDGKIITYTFDGDGDEDFSHIMTMADSCALEHPETCSEAVLQYLARKEAIQGLISRHLY